MTAAPTAAAHAEVAFQTGKKWIELLPRIKLMPPTSCGMGRGWLRAAIRALEELYPTKLAEVVPAHQTKHELTYGPRSPYLASA